MSLRQVFQSIKGPLEFSLKFVTLVSSVATAIGIISKFFEWGKKGPFNFLKENIQIVWLVSLSLAAVTFWIWTSRLHKRFVSGFKDNFSGDLRVNWDYQGSWRIGEKNTLLVTDSDAGGITKAGAQWENYTFDFKARIMDHCLGVIVRAQDLNNYYMLQITKDKIYPHRRAAVPAIDTSPPSVPEDRQKNGNTLNPIKFIVGWQISRPTPLPRHLDSWFHVKVTVRGESVLLHIDDELVFQDDSFLKIPTGKVGFRNHGREKALVRNVRVKLQT